jgi:uncharacterized protein YdeI (YjbR/CyaY-like superfamily)
MASHDSRIDAYIARSKPFARPILEHLRATVHRAVPNVEETIKWSFPHFTTNGENLCAMASFKEHCAFGFWKQSWMSDPKKIFNRGEKAMGSLGRITALRDLPSSTVLMAYLRSAATLNVKGSPAPKRPKRKAKPLVRTPNDLAKALARNAKAKAIFQGFPPSHKREYVEWILEAKSAETRSRRIETAVEWISQGKQRNWKYMK